MIADSKLDTLVSALIYSVSALIIVNDVEQKDFNEKAASAEKRPQETTRDEASRTVRSPTHNSEDDDSAGQSARGE